jgi:hypothetical protein
MRQRCFPSMYPTILRSTRFRGDSRPMAERALWQDDRDRGFSIPSWSVAVSESSSRSNDWLEQLANRKPCSFRFVSDAGTDAGSAPHWMGKIILGKEGKFIQSVPFLPLRNIKHRPAARRSQTLPSSCRRLGLPHAPVRTQHPLSCSL